MDWRIIFIDSNNHNRGQLLFFDKQSEYQPFFEAFDREKANDRNEYYYVKHIEQKIPVILACADGACKPDGMRQGYNFGKRANIGGQIGNRKDHARKEKHRRDKTREVKIEMVNRPDK